MATSPAVTSHSYVRMDLYAPVAVIVFVQMHNLT